MPRNMTMQEPRAGIIFFKGDGEVAIPREGGDVTTGRIDQVQGAGFEVEDAGGLADDPEVVAMEMDGVVEADSALILDYVDGPLIT
jgi:hypothetical protein